MAQYYFKNNEFVIEDYDKQKTFSSFLPGLAGKRGIPLWAFYVNRGQGITAFGLENKDSQILEFNPAVTAYQSVGTNGFRTFVKVNGSVHEIFGENNLKAERKMRIQRSEFSIEEVNHDLGLKFEVGYFGLPNENIAALVRQVKVTNLNDEDIQFELLDGLSQLFPFKIGNGDFKMLGNLLRSWMEVYSLDNNVGFYRMRSSSSDSAEVVEVVKGNFYVSSFEGKLVKPLVDNNLIFGYDTSKRFARRFETTSIKDLYELEQVTANKIPVGFTGVEVSLKSNETKQLNTVIGNIHSEEYLLEMKEKIGNEEFLNAKRIEASSEISNLLEEVEMKSSFPIFDDYIKQNYLDNLLRGGYPMILNGKDNNHVYHLFSRRHGDLERDYNYFTLAPEYYSQGNGNFRDVAQNRRSDVLLNPLVKDFNVKMFGSFIQADGFNPLGINGSSFVIKDKNKITELVVKLFKGDKIMEEVLKGKFTPGSIINTMATNCIETDLSDDELFDIIFESATQNYEADFGEGYWIDHWTYILDLVENYESIYPDMAKDTLFNDLSYSFYESPVYVLPRDEKICLTDNGLVRRFGSILHHDNEKIERLAMNPHGSNWMKDKDGREVKTSLFGKLLVLAINKIASLDPSGIGVEMEADKPGWNDAMNGLPGLFGSGVSETIELKRVVTYLKNNFDSSQVLELPKEFNTFITDLTEVLKNEFDDFKYWDAASTAKEEYREQIRFGTFGLEEIKGSKVTKVLELTNIKIDLALSKALRLGDGIYPTYLVHEVTDYEDILEDGNYKIGNYGLRTVKPKAFKMRALPFYLEAPARALKVMKNDQNKKSMFKRIKTSNIYDHELKFYKTSEFLDKESNEIGRGRSFTKGWQERESNFLHMSYKYILGLLKGGLYEEFYEEIKTNLTCFMDPTVYGRSTLENSSFIATSINPDPEVRGQGYVARLSGSTAEMLSIWTYMMYGKKPFVYEGNQLKLNLKPLLSKEFFSNKSVEFTFLGSTKVVYINDTNIDTFTPNFKVSKYVVDGEIMNEIIGADAIKVRDGLVKEIRVYF